MFKRIGLFLLANLAVIAVISLLLSIFNVQPYLTRQGLDYRSLLIYALIVGFTGSFISLLISKWMAKRAYNIQLITQPRTEQESWLLNRVQSLARQSQIGMPEVGIYDSPEPNAFATGWSKNNALVAVSSGLLYQLDRDEVEAVLGHEISHVANGDMVTMALLQGVVNTFVIFFARIAAYAVTTFLNRGDDEEQSTVGGFAYMATAMVFEILFGILASMLVMWFSRYREFRADAGSARLLGKEKMIRALNRLNTAVSAPQSEQPAFAAFKINNPNRLFALLSSHPPFEKRIAALQALR